MELVRFKTAPNKRATFLVQTSADKPVFLLRPACNTVVLVRPRRSPQRFKLVRSVEREETSCASVVAMATSFQAAG